MEWPSREILDAERSLKGRSRRFVWREITNIDDAAPGIMTTT
jgi:hypothetical protein